MKYEQAKDLSLPEFKRLFGVQRRTFEQMVEVMRQAAPRWNKVGEPPKLTLEDQTRFGLPERRENTARTNTIVQDWGVSESTVCRTVHKVETNLIRSGKFRLAGKKSLLCGKVPETVAIDVTESPIKRPQQRQKQFYSGKKKRHTLKSQLVVDLATAAVVCTAYGKGRRHDRVFQARGVRFHHQTQGLSDKGYQGIHKL